jgi:hypothetical protein
LIQIYAPGAEIDVDGPAGDASVHAARVFLNQGIEALRTRASALSK